MWSGILKERISRAGLELADFFVQLWTDVQVLIVIVNNGCMRLIRQHQMYVYGGLNYEVGLWYNSAYVNFARLAESFGAYGERVAGQRRSKAPSNAD